MQRRQRLRMNGDGVASNRRLHRRNSQTSAKNNPNETVSFGQISARAKIKLRDPNPRGRPHMSTKNTPARDGLLSAARDDVEMDVGQWASVQEYVAQLSAHCMHLRGSTRQLDEEAEEIRLVLALLQRKQQVNRALFGDDDEFDDNA
ncbi:Aste57867_13382 [Aphanomyces stellatus]|uniref:Aste57867_13382 protein n=1 Tax=Aphanomyces stellatus TaxID=120398 RepID=A0A485KXY5_9STRA|nr:hypothetical protein As57867_013332 [Aphanomyces stellatus]VFT90221.1 Aste57867_13382 [Aphanomyces stellatus]